MGKYLITFLFSGLTFGLFSCNTTSSIAGTYQSNFPALGFFGTRIKLNIDSTFEYRMRGDMMSDTATGNFKIKNQYLILNYIPIKPDTSLYSKYGKEAVLVSEALTSSNNGTGPKQYFIGHNKLFISDTTGKIYKKEFGYSKLKKYLLFGPHYFYRKFYLKRID